MPAILLFAAVLFAELIGFSFWLDLANLGYGRVASLVQHWGAWSVRAAVAFAVFGFTFAPSSSPVSYFRSEAVSSKRSTILALVAHGVALLVWAVLSSFLFRAATAAPDALVIAWLVCGCLAVALLCAAFFPSRIWAEAWNRYRSALLFAAAAAGLVSLAGVAAQPLWSRAAGITFDAVVALLRPFLLIRVVPERNQILTDSFGVAISSSCSGYEGIGLILAFTTIWLWTFRSEYRFPHALLLLPLGTVLAWSLNAIRIATLLLIGHSGNAAVATRGFHSQAGWIGFLLTALAIGHVSRRLNWFQRQRTSWSHAPAPAAPWLMPMLGLLATAMAVRALTADFEWLYPLRVLVVAGILLVYRKTYTSLEWRFSATAVLAGILTFFIWIVFDRWHGTASDAVIRDGLQALSPSLRIVWLISRVVGQIVTVPIAEELAFRGFLLRRLQGEDFEAIGFRRWTIPALMISSIAFGILHGDLWIEGALAGLIFAAVQIRTGRVASAIVAHAVTNALISVWVLTTGQYHLW